jgi:hypothetical protein
MRNALVIGGVLIYVLVPLALAAPALAASAAAVNAAATVPDKVVIDVATVNGSGCPAGTAAVAVSPDKTAFTVTYSNYLAQVGVGALATDLRKNCQLNVIVHVPQGFTYAIAGVDYRGFAHLEKGATATQRAAYYFQGQSQTGSATHTLKTTGDNDWQFTDNVAIAALAFAPCGEKRNLNINTELRVAAGTSNAKKTTSFVAMDSTDGDLSTIYRVSWKKC